MPASSWFCSCFRWQWSSKLLKQLAQSSFFQAFCTKEWQINGMFQHHIVVQVQHNSLTRLFTGRRRSAFKRPTFTRLFEWTVPGLVATQVSSQHGRTVGTLTETRGKTSDKVGLIYNTSRSLVLELTGELFLNCWVEFQIQQSSTARNLVA